MDDQADCDFAAAFSRVQRKVAQWRQRRRRGARIPEELWREAGQLARAQGINRTARALRLDYYSFKKRATAAAGSGVRVPEFVEMLPDDWSSRPAKS